MERERQLIAERERRLGTIASYFEQANLAFQRGEYALAREYANAILRWDPQNADASAMVDITYEAQHIRNTEEARRLFDDQWKSVMSDLKRDALPQVSVVEFPDDWLDGIARRRPRVVGDTGPVEDASMAAIHTTLESRRVKNLSWEEANLDTVVNYLRTITGLNFFISQKVRAEKFDEVVVNLQLDDVSAKTVLDLVTEPYELKWEPRGGVVTIATSDEIRGQMGIRYFDVKDLNVAIQNFVGTEINLVPSNFTPPEPPELPDPAPLFGSEALAGLIRNSIAPRSWDRGGALVSARMGRLFLRNTATVLAAVREQVDRLRREFLHIAVVEAELLEIERTPAVLDLLQGASTLDAAAVEQLRALIQGGGAQVIDAVRVTSLNGARNAVTSGRIFTYLADFEVEIAQASATPNPVIQEGLSGVVADLWPVRTSAGDAVHVTLRFTHSHLVEKRVGVTPHGRLELPRLDLSRQLGCLPLPLGRTTVAGTSAEGGRIRVLLLTPQIVGQGR
jgi:hypothetical protein